MLFQRLIGNYEQLDGDERLHLLSFSTALVNLLIDDLSLEMFSGSTDCLRWATVLCWREKLLPLILI